MRCGACVWVCVAAVGWWGVAEGATYHAYPGDNLNSLITSLGYGDTLIVHSVGGNGTGRYGRVGLLYSIVGDDPATPQTEWKTIMGAPGEAMPVIRYDLRDKNVMELRTVARYVKFVGLAISGGSDSIKIPGANGDHIVFEDLSLYDIGDTGINLSSCGDVSFMEIRGCEIFNTVAGTGEGMYLGQHGYQGTGQGILRDSIIERNYVHHCAGDQGDGIEVKYECYRNVVRDNVIHNTNYPGILAYGTGRPGSADNNIIERNVVWSSGDWAITAFQTTTVRNNVVFNSYECLHLSTRSDNSGLGHDGQLRDVYVYNNTFYSAEGRVAALYVTGKTGIEICNNLFYQPDAGMLAVYFDSSTPGAGVVAANNYYYGDTQNLPVSGFTLGPAPADAFVNASTTPGVIDLYLRSGTILESGGSNAYAPADDFNLVSRPVGGTVEPGAYELVGPSNPGWPIQAEFKGMPAALVSSEPAADGTLPKTQNNVILLTFDGAITLPGGAALTITSLPLPGTDVGGSFTYTVQPDGVTLKAKENGAVLSNLTWYRVTPGTGLYVEAFVLDVCALQGDADANGQVLAQDYFPVKNNLFAVTDARYDLDGSGQVLAQDYFVVKNHLFNAKPAKP